MVAETVNFMRLRKMIISHIKEDPKSNTITETK